MNKVTSFSGYYRFLSNFYPSPFRYVMFDNIYEFKTNEHFYQASKAINKKDAEMIINVVSPAEAKKLGNQITIRDNWDIIKNDIMFTGLTAKFFDKELRKMLMDTDGALLIEGNEWHDTYWGECPLGNGKNMLGKMLMELRNIYLFDPYM